MPSSQSRLLRHPSREAV